MKVLRTVAARTGIALDTVEWDFGAERYLRTGATITLAGMRELQGTTRSFSGAMGDPRVPDNAHARDILLGDRVCRDLREIVS